MNSYPLIMRFLGIDESRFIDRAYQILMNTNSHYLINIVHNELVLDVISSLSSITCLSKGILKILDSYFIGYGMGTIENTIGHKLLKSHLTITSAESLTCGMFQSTLGMIPGISSIFSGGFVTYSNYMKHKLLSIPLQLIDQKGVVSRSTAIWMAKQSQSIMGTDLSVSFTGVAGPDPLEGHPAGTVWIGLAYHHQVDAELYHLYPLCCGLMQYYRNKYSKINSHSINRNLIRRLSVKMGFKMINDKLKEYGY